MDHPIAQFRRTNNLSIEAFGALVGVGKSAVSKWELRRSGPSVAMALKIEEVTERRLTREQLRPDIWPPNVEGARS